MPRRPKPWYRRERRSWYVTIHGVQHKLGTNKQKAYERFHELMAQPQDAVSLQVCVPELVRLFLEWVALNRAEATHQWYRDRLTTFLRCCGDIPISELKPHQVEAWASRRCGSINTLRNNIQAVKRCLSWSVAQGYLSLNPIDSIEVPSPVPREDYVSPEEFTELLTFVPSSGFADLLRVTYETGCRPQESLRVEGRHVDLANSRWVFPPQESKGRKIPRVVYLNDTAKEITERGIRQWPDGKLFRNAKRIAWNKDSVGCAFDRLRVRIGMQKIEEEENSIASREISELAKRLPEKRISKGLEVQKSDAELRSEAKRKLTQKKARRAAPQLSLYVLRHSFCTNALKRGVDALTVAILMGHKDPSTIARTYQHLSLNPVHLLGQAKKATDTSKYD